MQIFAMFTQNVQILTIFPPKNAILEIFLKKDFLAEYKPMP